MADKKQTMLYGLLTSIASKITYDNTTSGLEADNVQDAIDEVNSNLIKVGTITANTSATGNIDTSISKSNRIILNAWIESNDVGYGYQVDVRYYGTNNGDEGKWYFFPHAYNNIANILSNTLVTIHYTYIEIT